LQKRVSSPAATLLDASEAARLPGSADSGGSRVGARIASITPDDLPDNAWDVREERAAIMHYDGELPRAQADAAALLDILQRIKRPSDTCLWPK
jgi:hypothetical protein